MERRTDSIEALLEAADDWLTALEVLGAARSASRKTVAEQEAAEVAEIRLALAVTAWRQNGET